MKHLTLKDALLEKTRRPLIPAAKTKPLKPRKDDEQSTLVYSATTYDKPSTTYDRPGTQKNVEDDEYIEKPGLALDQGTETMLNQSDNPKQAHEAYAELDRNLIRHLVLSLTASGIKSTTAKQVVKAWLNENMPERLR
jgi:hypothetical protein